MHLYLHKTFQSYYTSPFLPSLQVHSIKIRFRVTCPKIPYTFISFLVFRSSSSSSISVQLMILGPYLTMETAIIIIIIIIIIELTHSQTILENTVEIEPQPVALDFKNLSQYSSRSKPNCLLSLCCSYCNINLLQSITKLFGCST